MRLAAFVVTAVLPLLGWSGGGRPVDPGVVVNGGVRGSNPTRVPGASVPPPVVVTPPAKTPTTPVMPTSDISMAATSWIIGPIIDGQNYSHNMPLQPAQDGAGWSFDFPAMDGVHYVTTPYGGGALTASKIRMTVTIAADPSVQFRATQGDTSARVRLYFQRSGDDWRTETYRWWSNEFIELRPGTYTLEVPMTPDHWFDVHGHQASEPAVTGGFNAAKGSVMSVGMTFGGMFAGHGVYTAGGHARFTLQEFAVR